MVLKLFWHAFLFPLPLTSMSKLLALLPIVIAWHFHLINGNNYEHLLSSQGLLTLPQLFHLLLYTHYILSIYYKQANLLVKSLLKVILKAKIIYI